MSSRRVDFRRETEHRYRIPRHGRMRVDAVFYASRPILEDLAAEDYASLTQLCNVATLPGVVEPVLAMPDIHWGYGFPIGGVAAFDPADGGVVSPGGVGFDINCGVRLLISGLRREDLAPRKRALADTLYSSVPSGVGKGKERLELRELERIMAEGPARLVEQGYGEAEDLAHTESGGRLSGADTERVSHRALERGAGQLGSLGSGNHFLEVQYVDEIYDAETARVYGIEQGLVTVLIHTGSRGLGHQVCTDYVERFLETVPKYGVDLVDRQLAAAPIESPEGEAYLGAMAAAANYAFANRQLITHRVRRSFERAGLSADGPHLRVLYDLAHNNAKLEHHGGRPVLVHRKGATRAFGPGKRELPAEYRDAGQPVLVPGDMGRYSFVLAGTEGAMRETFGSSAHGAGRKLSRKKAKKAAGGRDLIRELEERGVTLRATSRATAAEEIPEAYKDASEVVDTTDRAGIGRKVARLRPLISVKG